MRLHLRYSLVICACLSVIHASTDVLPDAEISATQFSSTPSLTPTNLGDLTQSSSPDAKKDSQTYRDTVVNSPAESEQFQITSSDHPSDPLAASSQAQLGAQSLIDQSTTISMDRDK